MPQAQREWFEKDYYKVLGVSDGASDKEIKTAYRKLSKQYHPDATSGNEERFKEISAAYDVLGDGERRKEYDSVRKLGPIGGAFSGNGSPFGSGGGTSFRVEDITDLLGGVFNRGRGRGGSSAGGAGGGGARAAGPRRGADLEARLHLSFEEAVRGVETTVNVTSDVACSTCGGTGAAPGTSPVICSTCGGRGVTDDNQGFFSFSQPCRDCSGTGMRIESPCRDCRGSGIVRKPRQVRARIPAGVDDGQRMRLKGKGAVGANGGPSGDLLVAISVQPHARFGRKGHDLTMTVPVTFPEAALGATVTIPTLDGTVTLKIPTGTRSGRTFHVRGHGVPAAHHPGDLLVTVEVDVPSKLTDEERTAVERLRDVLQSNPRDRLEGPRDHPGGEPS